LKTLSKQSVAQVSGGLNPVDIDGVPHLDYKDAHILPPGSFAPCVMVPIDEWDNLVLMQYYAQSPLSAFIS